MSMKAYKVPDQCLTASNPLLGGLLKGLAEIVLLFPISIVRGVGWRRLPHQAWDCLVTQRCIQMIMVSRTPAAAAQSPGAHVTRRKIMPGLSITGGALVLCVVGA